MALLGLFAGAGLAETPAPRWMVQPPLLAPGPPASFDDVAVKDPSIVFHDGCWHLFYTACGKRGYALGYVSSSKLEALGDAPRHALVQLAGTSDRYAAAPQVFFFVPHDTWYLVYQTRDADYQPVYATTRTIDNPESWTLPRPLVLKKDDGKWIDFWMICDDSTAYLFYTRDHRDVYVMTTGLDAFPDGFANPRKVFGPVHEAVHVYKAVGLDEYHMLYEMRDGDGTRRFGLAKAQEPLGPWRTVDDAFATGNRLAYPPSVERWTEEVSHGELLRIGCDQRLEYNPAERRFLIQGLALGEHAGDYVKLPWKLGIVTLNAAPETP